MNSDNGNVGSYWPIAITIALSVFAGFLAVIWRYNLDPQGKGGSILALPIILTMFPLCMALFLVGVFTLDRKFGPFLVAASLLIPVSFFLLNRLV